MLVFDKNFNLIDLAFQQLDAAYVQPVGNGTKLPMQLLSLNKTIKEPGYVYIYLSNEGNVQQDIYFDDMTITHTKSKVSQGMIIIHLGSPTIPTLERTVYRIDGNFNRKNTSMT
jgi:hypothetical protein